MLTDLGTHVDAVAFVVLEFMLISVPSWNVDVVPCEDVFHKDGLWFVAL